MIKILFKKQRICSTFKSFQLSSFLKFPYSTPKAFIDDSDALKLNPNYISLRREIFDENNKNIFSILENKSPEQIQELKENLIQEAKVSQDPEFFLSLVDFLCKTRLFIKDFKEIVKRFQINEQFPIEFFLEMSEFLSDQQKISLWDKIQSSQLLSKTEDRTTLIKMLNFAGINSYHLRLSREAAITFIKAYDQIFSDKNFDFESNSLILNTIRALLSLSSLFLLEFQRPQKEKILSLIIKSFGIFSKDEQSIFSFYLVPLIVSFNNFLRRSPEEKLLPIYDEFMNVLLQKMKNGGLNANETQILCDRFIKSHEGESKSIFMKPEVKEYLIPMHKKFIEVYYQLYFGKAQVKKPPKAILIKIPKILHLANLIGFQKSTFYEAIEESIFLFQKYKEQEVFIKTFILTAFEVFQIKNLGNRDFYNLKKNTLEMLRLFQTYINQKNDSEAWELASTIIPSLRVAKLAGFKEEIEKNQEILVQNALDYAVFKGNRLDIYNFLDFFTYFFEEINTKSSGFKELEAVLQNILSGIMNISSYHYIFEIMSFLAYNVNLLYFKNEEKVYLQNKFHCFAAVQIRFADVIPTTLHNKMKFIKTLKNFFFKSKSFFLYKKKVRVLSLEEYGNIFTISKENIKIPKLSLEHPLFFPINKTLFEEELQKGLSFCLSNGNSLKNFEINEWIKYFGSLRYILHLAGNLKFTEECERFYKEALLNSTLENNQNKVIRFFLVFYFDTIFRSGIDENNPLLSELSKTLSAVFLSENPKIENLKIPYVIFLLKFLEGKRLKDEKLWKSITNIYSLERSSFGNLDELKFNSFDFSETQKKVDPSNLKKAFEKLDPQRINGANAYLAIISSPLRELESATLFHFEKVICNDIQSLDLVKLGNLAEKLNKWEYQALKLGIALKKVLESCFLANDQEFSAYELRALFKILKFLIESQIVPLEDIIPSLSFIQELRKNPEIALDFYSIFVEIQDGKKEYLQPFHEILKNEAVAEQAKFEDPAKKLLFLSALNLIDQSLIPNNLEKQCLDFDFTELMKNVSLRDNLPKIIRIFLKKTEISDTITKILQKVITNLFQEEKDFRKSFKTLLEFFPLGEKKPELLDECFKKLKLTTEWVEKLNSKYENKLILKIFCFILQINPQSNNDLNYFYNFIRKKIFSIPIDAFGMKEIILILKHIQKPNFDQKLLASLERASLINYKNNRLGLGEIYLEFCKQGLGSSIFLENVEKKIM